MGWLRRLPVFLLLAAAFCALMLLPASYALSVEDHQSARSFFYAGLLGAALTALVALALANRSRDQSSLQQLLGLLASYLLLPAFLAVPLYDSMQNTTFLSAYTEMVSALTTTGLPLFEPTRLNGTEHLWRGLVGWMGGLIIWVAAAAILAPLTLGGFEVTASGEPGQSIVDGSQVLRNAPEDRLWRSIEGLLPVYLGLTAALCVLLLVAGEEPLQATIRAMSTMSTSGILPVALDAPMASGLGGEVIVFGFLLFALSRLTFSADTVQTGRERLLQDPEFRLGLVIITVVPVALFLRHWVAAFEVGDEQNIFAGMRAFWGALFTALSFLSTTGFVSADWATAQDWSGLPTPGLILMGLALLGGGVATTAGGVKLLRVYALYLNGAREIERLVHPHSVGRTGHISRRIRREGGFIAWVFFMMVAVTLAALAIVLAALGASFHEAMILSVTVLSNTGPLSAIAAGDPINLLSLDVPLKLALCAGMVLGRLELLALIVMLSPEIWRD